MKKKQALVFVKSKRKRSDTGQPGRTGVLTKTEKDAETGDTVALVTWDGERKAERVKLGALALDEGRSLGMSLTHCKCGRRLTVMESRNQVIGGTQTVWRRRKCAECGGRSTTLEIDEATALKVLKHDE